MNNLRRRKELEAAAAEPIIPSEGFPEIGLPCPHFKPGQLLLTARRVEATRFRTRPLAPPAKRSIRVAPTLAARPASSTSAGIGGGDLARSRPGRRLMLAKGFGRWVVGAVRAGILRDIQEAGHGLIESPVAFLRGGNRILQARLCASQAASL
jgi:hypothetical protein